MHKITLKQSGVASQEQVIVVKGWFGLALTLYKIYTTFYIVYRPVNGLGSNTLKNITCFYCNNGKTTLFYVKIEPV